MSGALLVREWNGRLERVMILDDGYAWNGAVYRSLSQVAKAITGTNRNGHRFFGLKRATSGAASRKRSAAASQDLPIDAGRSPIPAASEGGSETHQTASQVDSRSGHDQAPGRATSNQEFGR
jgi:hypothetical protein